MKKLIIGMCITMALGGCSSLNLGDTVAGGQDGEVDYCVTVMNVQALCIKGRRATPGSEGEG